MKAEIFSIAYYPGPESTRKSFLGTVASEWNLSAASYLVWNISMNVAVISGRCPWDVSKPGLIFDHQHLKLHHTPAVVCVSKRPIRLVRVPVLIMATHSSRVYDPVSMLSGKAKTLTCLRLTTTTHWIGQRRRQIVSTTSRECVAHPERNSLTKPFFFILQFTYTISYHTTLQR